MSAPPTEYVVSYPDRDLYAHYSARHRTADVDLALYWEERDAATLPKARALAKKLKPKCINGEPIIKRRTNIRDDGWFDWTWDEEEVS